MSDIALQWDPQALTSDLAIEANDLAQDDGLRTAVVLSLFTDRRAEEGDVLPDNATTDRRGWWADAVAAIEGDKHGSRLWLLSRSKKTPDVLTRAEDYAREALQWLVEDKVAAAVSVAASFLDRPFRGYSLDITITRPQKDPARYRFDRTWDAEGARI